MYPLSGLLTYTFPDQVIFYSISRVAWQSLGTMAKEEAMQKFVDQLQALCPLFKPYLEAHKAEREEQERKK